MRSLSKVCQKLIKKLNWMYCAKGVANSCMSKDVIKVRTIKKIKNFWGNDIEETIDELH